MASPLNAIETELAKKMMGVFGSVISNRAAYFQTHSQEGLDPKSVQSIIRKYAAVNFTDSDTDDLISLSSSFVKVVG